MEFWVIGRVQPEGELFPGKIHIGPAWLLVDGVMYDSETKAKEAAQKVAIKAIGETFTVMKCVGSVVAKPPMEWS